MDLKSLFVGVLWLASLPAWAQQSPPPATAPAPNYPSPTAPQNAPAPAPGAMPPGNAPPPQNYQPAPPGYAPAPNGQAAPPNAPPPGYPRSYQTPAPVYPPPNWQPYNSPAPDVLRYHPLRAQVEGGYTLTENDAAQAWHNGGNVGLGLTWFPSAVIPLGLRVDGSYSRFDATWQSLNDVAQATNSQVIDGHLNTYGGDVDAELDIPLNPRTRAYLFGGAGWYREQSEFRAAGYCGFYCGPGYYYGGYTVERYTTEWLHSWNAGLGFEFAISDPLSFFVEARYLRIQPYSERNAYIPLRVGLRF
jgi:opacity protein-like surface antigen